MKTMKTTQTKHKHPFSPFGRRGALLFLLLLLALGSLYSLRTCSGEWVPLPPGVTLPVAAPETADADMPQENAAPQAMQEALAETAIAPSPPAEAGTPPEAFYETAPVPAFPAQAAQAARRETPAPPPAEAAETIPPEAPAQAGTLPETPAKTAIAPPPPGEAGTPPKAPAQAGKLPEPPAKTAIAPPPPGEAGTPPKAPAQAGKLPETPAKTAIAPPPPAEAGTPPKAFAPETPAASRRLRWEFGVYGTAGFTQLLATMSAGAMQADRLHVGGGADITCFFSPRWGLSAGIEIASADARLSAADIQQGNNFTSVLVKQEETLAATFLHIPLMAQFRLPVRRHFFYAAAGAKFDLALSGSYHATGSRHSSTAADEAWNASGSLRFGHGASLAAESGVRWTLRRKWGLYTGIYAAYGLSDIRPEAGAADAGKLGENSLLFVRRASGEPYVGAIRLFAAGININLQIDN
jgi:hypothetical protein